MRRFQFRGQQRRRNGREGQDEGRTEVAPQPLQQAEWSREGHFLFDVEVKPVEREDAQECEERVVVSRELCCLVAFACDVMVYAEMASQRVLYDI